MCRSAGWDLLEGQLATYSTGPRGVTALMARPEEEVRRSRQGKLGWLPAATRVVVGLVIVVGVVVV